MLSRTIGFALSLAAFPWATSFVSIPAARPVRNHHGSVPCTSSLRPLQATSTYLEGLGQAVASSSATTNYDASLTNGHTNRSSSPFRTTKIINPKYPSYSFDKYLENPYFQQINTAYPGLQLINEEPYIFIINNFLTPNECARLRAKADQQGMLRPQIGGGAVQRTSTGVVCIHDEVPTIQHKMMQLTNVDDIRQLQYLKVSKYQQGQTFSKHTDAWPTEGAPISRGWVNAKDFFGDDRRRTVGCLPALEQPNHNTLLTCFVYLNDVAEGGCTCFPNIGIHAGRQGLNFYTHPAPMDSRWRHESDGSATAWDWDYRTPGTEPLRIQPECGMAVLHLCSLLPEHGGITDGNTMHVAEPPAPGNEKYVSQQFFSSCTEWILPDDSVPEGRVSWDTI